MTVDLTSPEFPGLRVAGATDPGVGAFVASCHPSAAARDLLPYSVVIENHTPQTIRAYTLHLSFVDGNGNPGGIVRQYFNFEPTGNGMEIPPGAAQLVNPVWSYAACRPKIGGLSGTGPGSFEEVRLADRLRSQVAATLSLDLVVFDSGHTIGPNQRNTLAYLAGYLTGELETASLVRTAANAGASVQEISGQLQQLAAQMDTQPLGDAGKMARAGLARRFLSFSSREKMLAEADRLLAKPSRVLLPLDPDASKY